ncbi:MAG TPA: ABC transporter ATP-binding protein [Myxococcota bacterium]|nr:ABC transporter ATP-binding protein [Myxococcota bacterium]
MSEPAETTTSKTDLSLLRRVAAYVREDRAWFWLVLVLTPLGVAAEVVQPVLMKIGIDEHITRGDLAGLGTIALLFAGAVFFAWLSSSLGYHALQRVSLRGLARLRSAIYDHVMAQSGRFFDKRHAGSLMTRTINDVDAVYESLARGAIQLLTNLLTIIGMLVAMLMMDASLTLVAFLFSPVIWFVVGWFRKRLRPISLEIRETLARLNGYFAERVFGMTVVQLYGAERVSIRTFDAMSERYMRAYHKSNWLDAGLYAVMDGMGALATAAIVWFFALQFTGDAQSSLTLGLLVAFVDYLGRIFVPIRELSAQIATLQRSFAALEKIFSLIDTDERVPDGPARLSQPVVGHVRLSGTRFRYAPQLPEVLKGIDLEIRPGRVVAIVGATGSGKSTIGKLLTRMYPGYEGSITLDGLELKDLACRDVRDAITVVHQDPWLMEGTVADNIRLGDSRVSDTDIERAAELSRAKTFIDELPGGFAGLITERGKNLSTGQRQLLSIARALARKAPIVILDEATASVDPMTERHIDEAMEALFRERTVIVIAHRLQTIRKADMIVVLHKGEVAEVGSHDELMVREGRYRDLVETGFAL